MAVILNIDTATEYAGVCLSRDEEILAIQESADQKNHAAFVQPAIKKIFEEAGYKLSAVDAVSVTAGPGSYTGLRVGLSSAKGLCYALQKPLLLVNTLEVMALASVKHTAEQQILTDDFLFCPMIDARRMEIFTALYNKNIQPVISPAAMIVNEKSFEDFFTEYKIIFSGSGCHKLQNIIHQPKAIFSEVQHNASHLAILSFKYFLQKKFADIAYSEPFYLKEFFTPPAKNQETV